MQLVSTVTLGSAASSITFSSIPSTASDILLLISGRSAGSDSKMLLSFNGSTASFSNRYLLGTGSAVVSGTDDQRRAGTVNVSGATASTFANTALYIPNYAGSANKTWSSDSVYENNASEAYQTIIAGSWTSTAAITSVTLTISGGANFDIGSTASLYIITKA